MTHFVDYQDVDTLELRLVPVYDCKHVLGAIRHAVDDLHAKPETVRVWRAAEGPFTITLGPRKLEQAS